MIDMHCHILPGIDDGARTVQEAMELLRAEKEQGVDKIVFTPHFHPERIPLDKFLTLRDESWERLRQTEGFEALEIETKLGAEVYFSVRLNEMDLSKLCFEGTEYILIELSTRARPYGVTHIMRHIIEHGYTPILAHIERYPYFTADPTQLYELIEMGCAAQVNAAAVTDGVSMKGVSALQYIHWELAQIICSDAHSMDERPPNTKAAYQLVAKKLGDSYTEWLQKNSLAIFQNKLMDMPVIHRPKKFLGRWR